MKYNIHVSVYDDLYEQKCVCVGVCECETERWNVRDVRDRETRTMHISDSMHSCVVCV